MEKGEHDQVDEQHDNPKDHDDDLRHPKERNINRMGFLFCISGFENPLLLSLFVYVAPPLQAD